MSQNMVGRESRAQSAALEEPALTHQLDTSLLMVMAVACGVFVANIYFNQPILELLQQAFPRSVSLINLVPTATQLGFACGLFFLVPLGDRIDRRKLILWQAAVLIVALVGLAAAPNAWSLVIASAVVGVSGSVAQQIVPFAAELAASNRRGQVVGTVMSGVLCGILLGRAVGGFTGDHWGWRATFWLGAAMSAIVWLMLLIRLPHSEPKTSHSYFGLMKSWSCGERNGHCAVQRAFKPRCSVPLLGYGQFWHCVCTRPSAWELMWQALWGSLVQPVF
jgi:predicted MFS family arabinose efflux permease